MDRYIQAALAFIIIAGAGLLGALSYAPQIMLTILALMIISSRWKSLRKPYNFVMAFGVLIIPLFFSASTNYKTPVGDTKIAQCERHAEKYIACTKAGDPSSRECIRFQESDNWYFNQYGVEARFDCVPLGLGA